jgi:hypothetical protein
MINRLRHVLILLALSTTACAGDQSLQAAFEAQMKDNGYDSYEIIWIQENETDGWVLHTAWTDQYPDNRSEPGVNYYQKQGKKWQNAMGTGCSKSGVSMFGLMGNGYLYCSVLRSNMDLAKITAGGEEGKIFPFNNDTMKVWVAVSPKVNAKLIGTSPDGHEYPLN